MLICALLGSCRGASLDQADHLQKGPTDHHQPNEVCQFCNSYGQHTNEETSGQCLARKYLVKLNNHCHDELVNLDIWRLGENSDKNIQAIRSQSPQDIEIKTKGLSQKRSHPELTEAVDGRTFSNANNIY